MSAAEARGTSRLWEVLENVTQAPIGDGIGEFFEGQPLAYQETVAESIDHLFSHSTPAFKATTEADIGIAIPISFQESNFVSQALALYGRQRRMPSTLIAGYLNWPDDVDAREAARTRRTVNRFIADNPQIPFGFFEGQEQTPISIGRIRKLGTEVVMPLIRPDGLLLGHDADQEGLNALHLRNMRMAYAFNRATCGLATVLADIGHTHPAHLPNMNHVIRWFEDPEVSQLVYRFFEPGPGFGAIEYRKVGGYSPEDTMAETHELIWRIDHEYGSFSDRDARVHDARLIISPRRLIQKLDAGLGVSDFWSDDQDFRGTERYRAVSDRSFSNVPDITAEMRDLHLCEFGSQIQREALNIHAYDDSYDIGYVLGRLKKIRKRLGGPVAMFG